MRTHHITKQNTQVQIKQKIKKHIRKTNSNSKYGQKSFSASPKLHSEFKYFNNTKSSDIEPILELFNTFQFSHSELEPYSKNTHKF